MCPLASHESVQDKETPGLLGIDTRVGNATVGHDRQSQHGDPLHADRPRLASRPHGLGVRPLREISGEWLDPGGVDPGHHAAPQSSRVDQLGGHHPLGPCAREDRAGPQCESRVPGAPVRRQACRARALVGCAHTDVREQAGEDRSMDGIAIAGRPRGGALEPQRCAELADEVLPLAHAQVVDELLSAPGPESRRRLRCLGLLEVVPEVEQREDVRRGVDESRVSCIRSGGTLLGSLARVPDSERCRHDDDVVGASLPLGLHDHPAESRVHGQSRESTPNVGDTAAQGLSGARRCERTHLLEDGDTRRHGPAIGWVEEGEGVDLPEPEGRHLQQHAREVGTQDLRVRELRSRA